MSFLTLHARDSIHLWAQCSRANPAKNGNIGKTKRPKRIYRSGSLVEPFLLRCAERSHGVCSDPFREYVFRSPTAFKPNRNPNHAVHPTATRVTLHAWSLRSRHGSRHGQPWVTADVREKYRPLTCVAFVIHCWHVTVCRSPRKN